MSFIEELKRRNVFRVGIAYGVATWLLIQVSDTVFPRIGLPDSAVTLVIALLAIGFIPALIFAWAFELTPEGIKREADVDRDESITPQTSKKLDKVIIGGLVLIILGMGVERAWFATSNSIVDGTSDAGGLESAAITPSGNGMDATRQESVAVLPFAAMSSGEDDEYFADGLTEEILNSLAQLPELLVTARTSSFHFKGQNLPVQEIAATLGVDHVVEGSVRRAGDQVRITAQLIRAGDGFHLWSDTYDRTLEDVFAIQDEIAANIAETLDVVLNEDKREAMRRAGINNVQAFIDYQKGLDLFHQAHTTDNPSADLPEANHYFDRVLAVAPDFTDAALLRADLYGHILYGHATNQAPAGQADLDRARTEILESLATAARATRSSAMRANLEADRLYFTDDWSGIPAQINLMLSTENCMPMNWAPTLAGTFGWADQLVAHYERTLTCDPLNGIAMVMYTHYLIWAGNAAESFELAGAYLRDVQFHPWVDDSRFLAGLASGLHREDTAYYNPNPEGSNFWMPRAILAYAMDEKFDEARRLWTDHIGDNSWDDASMIIAGAALGDREMANAAAGRIDARFAGPFLLAEITKGCACGAPFDLDATPNFKQRIEEAGFTWPPASPVKFPAKDW